MYTDYLYNVGYNYPYPMGVYALLCLPSYRMYIGSTKNLTHRAAQHFRSLEEGIHPNRELQYQFDLHGPSSFSFVILERTTQVNQLADLEQAWVNRLQHRLLNRHRTVSRPSDEKLDPVDLVPMPWEEE